MLFRSPYFFISRAIPGWTSANCSSVISACFVLIVVTFFSSAKLDSLSCTFKSVCLYGNSQTLKPGDDVRLLVEFKCPICSQELEDDRDLANFLVCKNNSHGLLRFYTGDGCFFTTRSEERRVGKEAS